MLVAVSPRKKTSKKANPKKTSPKKAAPARKRSRARSAGPTFAEALADLLRSRKLKVPRGLRSAPPDAYGRSDASSIDAFRELPDEALVAQAERVAGYASRQRERAKREWESSALVAEIRRRKLKVPPGPKRVVGASVSLRKPLGEWSDAELLAAARDWSGRGR